MEKLLLLLLLIVFSCKNKEQTNTDASNVKTEDVENSKKSSEDVKTVSLEKLWETEAVLTTAESVLFDEARGLYYVSCINGVPPTEEDGDGFIATVDQRGKILDQSFVSNLDAPKGMAMDAENLYVTDINEFVVINLATKKMQRISIPGAKFLNDVAMADDGSVYFTDMMTNTVHKYSKGNVEVFLKDENLPGPNGIYIEGNKMYIASFSTGNFFEIDMDSKSISTKFEKTFGSGDGVAPWKGGFVVSDWNGDIFYSNANWENNKILENRGDKINSADISVNQKSGELLVPTFFGNTVAAYKIK